MEKQPLITTVDLKKVYRIKSDRTIQEVIAIDNINLKIFKGETFGVIGESGSGKTTLGKTIIKLIEPTSGEIYFRNNNLLALDNRNLRNIRRHFQIVFQDPYKSLNPRLSVGSAVAESICCSDRKRSTERAKEILQTVGISPKRYDQYPHQFSGGERQRIAIARALSTEPEFIVCDEPTSNLDLSIQAKILNLFLDLKETLGLTYLFISHNLQVMKFISDRIAVIYRGKIVEEGETSQIITHPQHPYTKTLLSKV